VVNAVSFQKITVIEESAHHGGADLRVKVLQPVDAGRWDEFVLACPEATFFHRAGWKEVIERAFGHETYFLYAERGGRIEGVLPLVHMRSRLFGNALSSTPFCVYGGIAANCADARGALDDHAQRLARERGVDYLEMRNLRPRHGDWPVKDLYVTFRRDLDPDPDTNMAAVPRKQRAMIRKGIAACLQSHVSDDMEAFYRVYAESVRNLGTPVFSKKYFRLLKEVFGGACELLTVTSGDKPVAGVMSFYFRDEVLPYYGGGVNSARDMKANDFMYWELMRRSCERGIRVFDYGRSKKGTGSYRFKTHWGFEPQPLYYEYCLVKAKEMPDINPLNPKYEAFINIWRRLPLPLTKLIGPYIVKNLG
jgi:FemAB-related protein (PEP-CTERM system-associated)